MRPQQLPMTLGTGSTNAFFAKKSSTLAEPWEVIRTLTGSSLEITKEPTTGASQRKDKHSARFPHQLPRTSLGTTIISMSVRWLGKLSNLRPLGLGWISMLCLVMLVVVVEKKWIWNSGFISKKNYLVSLPFFLCWFVFFWIN